MGSESEVASLREAIEAFDRAFAEGRFEDFLETFADDARLLVHEEAPVRELDAIRSAFCPVFEQIEAAEYRPRYEVVDVHGDRAYVLGSFDEVLRARGGTTGIRVQGRSCTSGVGSKVAGGSRCS